MTIYSYPKINLALDILKRPAERRAGYHKIRTVLHQLDAPCDEIFLEARRDGVCSVTCDSPKVPFDSTNTALKAALLLRHHIGAHCPGVSIHIMKKISLSSGLGGGSSNAVATFRGLAKLWHVKCCNSLQHNAPECLLWRLAEQIGMDCPFFFSGGTALGTHYGEKIAPLPPVPSSLHFEIIETGIEMSSHVAYENLHMEMCGKNGARTKALIAALERKDDGAVLENIHNDFEPSIFDRYPKLHALKKELQNKERCRIFLAGSGGALVKATLYSTP